MFELINAAKSILRGISQGSVLALLLLIVTSASGFAADLVYISGRRQANDTRKKSQVAADFYGLTEDILVAEDRNEHSGDVLPIRGSTPFAVIIEADALPFLKSKTFFAELKAHARGAAVLITGIDEDTDPALLQKWSAGKITGCKKVTLEQNTDARAIVAANDVTQQVAGAALPLKERGLPYLTLKESGGVQSLITAASGRDTLTTFAITQVGVVKIFFAVAGQFLDSSVTPDPYREPIVFAALAPELIFLRYAAGERAWHSPAPYANLTIDDPWLREPYGSVDYERLLTEMNRHNFHTTIAFVPWNFDRSQPGVISLFRSHTDRYSISIHGNNHDHREFGPYDRRPLGDQAEDAKQGLARMARFCELTGLRDDPVMVFPHAIAPTETLAVLKRYNFLATANSLNVPLGATTPADPEFVLRTVTMAFSNFPSLRRYSAEAPIPQAQLAVDSFLGNPMLFYVHQSFFAAGIDAFDRTADLVNRLQPGTQWRSLGYIANHLYLEKLRSDGNYDVRTYSAVIHLENNHHRKAKFFVEKEENFALPLTLFVDGQPYPYSRLGQRLNLQLEIPDGVTRKIEIRYKNDLNLAGVDVSKKSFHVNLIRELSDFRDDVVAKTTLGRWFIRSYSDNIRWWNRVLGTLAALSLAAAVLWYVRIRRRRSTKSLQARFDCHGCA